MSNVPNPSRRLAASLDSDPAAAATYFFAKIAAQWKLLLACAIVVPAVAVFLAYQLPSTFKANAQILIRHQGGDSALYGDLVPSVGSISGASAAEILRSDPITSLMIEKVGVEMEDIARPGYKVLFGKVAALILPLFGREVEDTRLKGNPQIKYVILAKELKPSITTATLVMERSAASIDEVVSVEIKSTDREKAAAMVNGLCDAFIATHNEQRIAEIRSVQRQIEQQTALALAELTRRQSAETAPDTSALEGAPTAATKSLSSGLAHTAAELESKVAEVGQTYTENSPEVQRVRLQLSRVRQLLARQETIDASSDLLGILQRKQRQLQIAADLFTQEGGDISVVERGLPTRKSKFVTIVKYGVPALAGLFGGLFFGCIAILALDTLRPSISNAEESAKLLDLPLLGSLPRAVLSLPPLERFEALPAAEARPGLISILADWEASDAPGTRVLAIATAGLEPGAMAIAAQLAGLIGRGKDHALLLVDANFDAPCLAAASDSRGLLDYLTRRSSLTEVIRPTGLPLVHFVSTGTARWRDEVGAPHEQWKRFIEEAKATYRTVIVATGGVASSREANALVQAGDGILVVTNEGKSSKQALKKLAVLLLQRQLTPLGVACIKSV